MFVSVSIYENLNCEISWHNKFNVTILSCMNI